MSWQRERRWRRFCGNKQSWFVIDYILKLSPRARRLRLAVYHDGRVVVTAPRMMNPRLIEPLIMQKSTWILSKLAFFKNFSGTILPRSTKKDFIEHKQEALTLAKDRIEHFNKMYHFVFKKITIKNQKTRWGSCSRKGHLNFNYKIAFLPKHVADYIIVHELCHLGELNHSKKFWSLVAKTIPDYREIRAELKQHRIHFL